MSVEHFGTLAFLHDLGTSHVRATSYARATSYVRATSRVRATSLVRATSHVRGAVAPFEFRHAAACAALRGATQLFCSVTWTHFFPSLGDDTPMVLYANAALRTICNRPSPLGRSR